MSDEVVPATLRIRDLPAACAGRSLGLCAGDVLLAVNGRTFQGDAAALQRLVAASGYTAALTFQRGAVEVTVLVGTSTLCRWDAVPAPAEDRARRRIDPAFLRNWEVMRARDGGYDLFAMRLPTLGLVAPQLWLMQMRLWLPCAILVSAVAAGFIVHPLLALAVQGAGAVHLRWAHVMYLRLDRRSRGFGFHTVVAARSEAAAHAAYRALQPDDRYLFAATPKQREAVAA